jgi:hypothetical protein
VISLFLPVALKMRHFFAFLIIIILTKQTLRGIQKVNQQKHKEKCRVVFLWTIRSHMQLGIYFISTLISGGSFHVEVIKVTPSECVSVLITLVARRCFSLSGTQDLLVLLPFISQFDPQAHTPERKSRCWLMRICVCVCVQSHRISQSRFVSLRAAHPPPRFHPRPERALGI